MILQQINIRIRCDRDHPEQDLVRYLDHYADGLKTNIELAVKNYTASFPIYDDLTVEVE